MLFCFEFNFHSKVNRESQSKLKLFYTNLDGQISYCNSPFSLLTKIMIANVNLKESKIQILESMNSCFIQSEEQKNCVSVFNRNSTLFFLEKMQEKIFSLQNSQTYISMAIFSALNYITLSRSTLWAFLARCKTVLKIS